MRKDCEGCDGSTEAAHREQSVRKLPRHLHSKLSLQRDAAMHLPQRGAPTQRRNEARSEILGPPLVAVVRFQQLDLSLSVTSSDRTTGNREVMNAVAAIAFATSENFSTVQNV